MFSLSALPTSPFAAKGAAASTFGRFSQDLQSIRTASILAALVWQRLTRLRAHAPIGPAVYRKVSIKGAASCAACPSKENGQLVAVFIPEVKGSPASAGIYDYSKPEPTPRTRKGFFRTQGRAAARALVVAWARMRARPGARLVHGEDTYKA